LVIHSKYLCKYLTLNDIQKTIMTQDEMKQAVAQEALNYVVEGTIIGDSLG
jgi:hypothetical protein